LNDLNPTINLNQSLTHNGTVLEINHTVTIHGNGYTLDGNESRILYIQNGGNVSLHNLHFQNGNASDGGAIENQGTIVSMTNCNFTDNAATDHGGAIENVGTIETMDGCNFLGNTAGDDGGAIENDDGTITSMTNCDFIGNTAGDGGAIENDGTITSITNCHFTENDATDGGAVCEKGDNTMYISCIFSKNQAFGEGTGDGWGGAVFIGGKTIQMVDCVFSENEADDGGAICIQGENNTVSECEFRGNHANETGGAVYNDGENNQIMDSVFKCNTCGDLIGCTINSTKNMTVTGTLAPFEENEVPGFLSGLDEAIGGECNDNEWVENMVITDDDTTLNVILWIVASIGGLVMLALMWRWCMIKTPPASGGSFIGSEFRMPILHKRSV